MSVKQISVFIENKRGKLAEATRYIADHDINLKALSIADTQDFGILRIICENPEKANDTPGSLASILEVLSEANVVVEYTYAFLSAKAGAYMIFRVDDNQSAAASLAAAGIKTANQTDLF